MTWVKLDDNAPDDPRALKVPRTARLLHIEALAWSSRHQTDGMVPRSALPRVTDEPNPEGTAELLVAAGLWDATDDGYRLVWLQDMQPGPEEVARQRAYNRDKQERHRKHVTGDHSTCKAPFCKLARNPVSNPVSNRTPSRPVPSIPVGDMTGKDGVAAGLEAAAPIREKGPTRRELAAIIRAARNPKDRGRYIRAYRATFGSAYPESRGHVTPHLSLRTIIREEGAAA